MPVSFAPVRSAARSVMFHLPKPLVPAMPANDDDDANHSDRELTLDAALRHFARHGLGAARAACAEAEAASLCGDEVATATWLAICRVLDRRLAADLESRLTSLSSATR